MGRQAISRCVCGNHGRYFKPRFADQVAFMPKLNQTISKSKKENVTQRNISSELICGFAERDLTNIYLAIRVDSCG